MQISDFLAAADAEIAGLREPSVVDLTVCNTDAAVAHASVRAFLAHRWALEPAAAPCHCAVERYDWHRPSPQPTMRRLRHVAQGATTLRLPRGTHILRLATDSSFLHRLSVWSADKFGLQAAAGVLPRQGVHLLEAAGAVQPLAAGAWRVVCRHAFRVPEACRVSITLQVAPAATQHCVAVHLVDLDSAACTLLHLAAAELRPMQPNASGYMVVALMHAPEATPGGSYTLQVTSDKALSDFSSVPSERCDRIGGTYAANSRAEVWRYVISPTQACTLALRLTSSLLGGAGTLELRPAPADAVGSKGKGAPAPAPPEATEALIRVPLSANATLPVLSVPAGPHVLSFTLDRERCTFGIEADGTIAPALPLGEVGASARSLAWELFIAPTVDEKACTITVDTSVAVAQQAQLRQWVEQGAGGAKDRPKRSEAALVKYRDARQRAAESGEAPTVVRPLLRACSNVRIPHARTLEVR